MSLARHLEMGPQGVHYSHPLLHVALKDEENAEDNFLTETEYTLTHLDR